MLENIYTTKMSNSGKKLKKRFSKILSAKHRRITEVIIAVVFLLLAGTLSFAGSHGLSESFYFDAATEGNGEGLSRKAAKSLQENVDKGHFPWRLHADETVKSIMTYLLSGDYENGTIISINEGEEYASALYLYGDKEYKVNLYKPARKDKTGIWAIHSFEEKGYGKAIGRTGIFPDNTEIYSNSFYENNIAKADKYDTCYVIYENESSYFIEMPVMSIPPTRGFVKKESISFEEKLFLQANYGVIRDFVTVYNSPSEKDVYSRKGNGGVIHIEKRYGDWAEISFPGGIDSKWVKTNEIEYLLK